MGRLHRGGVTGGSGVGDISVTATTFTAPLNQDITMDAEGTGVFKIASDAQLQAQGDLRFADADSSNYVAFQAPSTVAANLTWTLPATDGTANQVLSTNGSTLLSWASTGLTLSNETASATVHYPLLNTSTSGVSGSANVSTTKLSFQPSIGRLTLGGNNASTTTTSGTLVVTGGIGVSGAIYAGSDIVAYAASDIRLKENLSKIDNSLEKLLKISGYQYYWNKIAQEMHPERTMLDVGVLAHEIKEVLPSAVVKRADGYLAVNYDKLIPLLIESVKTLKEEVDRIKNYFFKNGEK